MNVSIDATQSNRYPRNYFSTLLATLQDNTWFAGDWSVITGKYFRKCDDSQEITVYENGGNEITIIVEAGGGSTEGVPIKQGIWTASDFPTTSGVDEDGVEIKDGYFWLIGGSDYVNIAGVDLPPNTWLVANQDNPTSDFSVTGWKYF